jgi:hypothetical protein
MSLDMFGSTSVALPAAARTSLRGSRSRVIRDFYLRDGGFDRDTPVFAHGLEGVAPHAPEL